MATIARIPRCAETVDERRRRLAAARQKRYRERQKAGLMVVPLEVSQDRLGMMIVQGRISSRDALRPERVAEVFDEIIESVLGA